MKTVSPTTTTTTIRVLVNRRTGPGALVSGQRVHILSVQGSPLLFFSGPLASRGGDGTTYCCMSRCASPCRFLVSRAIEFARDSRVHVYYTHHYFCIVRSLPGAFAKRPVFYHDGITYRVCLPPPWIVRGCLLRMKEDLERRSTAEAVRTSCVCMLLTSTCDAKLCESAEKPKELQRKGRAHSGGEALLLWRWMHEYFNIRPRTTIGLSSLRGPTVETLLFWSGTFVKDTLCVSRCGTRISSLPSEGRGDR